jgi:hypothetical protein
MSLQSWVASQIKSTCFLNAMTNSATASGEWREPEAHSFIVKIWLEQTNPKAGEVQWQGSVTHVPGGERRSVNDLAEIVELMARHLRALGVHLGMKWRIWLWLFRP